jgi:hypothetical protein
MKTNDTNAAMSSTLTPGKIYRLTRTVVAKTKGGKVAAAQNGLEAGTEYIIRRHTHGNVHLFAVAFEWFHAPTYRESDPVWADLVAALEPVRMTLCRAIRAFPDLDGWIADHIEDAAGITEDMVLTAIADAVHDEDLERKTEDARHEATN